MAGFRDKYPALPTGQYVSGDEKKVMIEQGIPFVIKGVADDDANSYGARFVLSITMPNPETGDEEDRLIGFRKGTVQSRDADLTNLKAYLVEDAPEGVGAKLTLNGTSQILVFEG